MKILHLIDSGGLYGAENVLLNLAREQLENQGLEPIILSAGVIGETSKALELSAKSMNLPVKSWRMRSGLNLVEAKNIIQYAKSEGVDLLHSHGYKFNVLMGLLSRYQRAMPLIATMHGYTKHPVLSKAWLYNLVDRLTLSRMDQVVAVNAGLRKSIVFSLDDARFHVVNNGIECSIMESNISSLDADVIAFVEAKTKIIGAVGRLSVEKAYDELIEAAASIIKQDSGVGLLIIGDGPEYETLKALASELNISDHVMFTGYREQACKFMPSMDVLVISSHTEGLPINLLEAMSVNCPVVATKVGAIPAVLDEGRCGTLVDVGDLSGLSHAIKSVLHQAFDVEGMCKHANEQVKSKFSVQSMAQEYLEIYKKSLSVS